MENPRKRDRTNCSQLGQVRPVHSVSSQSPSVLELKMLLFPRYRKGTSLLQVKVRVLTLMVPQIPSAYDILHAKVLNFGVECPECHQNRVVSAILKREK